jgi:antitoxin component YwqK of YwqJK toxin-antitoxin module
MILRNALKTECNESNYVYDTKGNLLKSYTIDEYGSINDSTNYIYKRSGVCIEIIRFSENKLTGREVPVFESGKVTGVQTYDENGKLETKLIYTYSGNEISEEKALNSNGEVVSIVKREFINGQIVTETEIDNNRKVISISKFKRNASNDITECLITVAKDKKEYKLMYEYEYDDAGNWIKQTRLYDNQIVNIVVRNIEYYRV